MKVKTLFILLFCSTTSFASTHNDYVETPIGSGFSSTFSGITILIYLVIAFILFCIISSIVLHIYYWLFPNKIPWKQKNNNQSDIVTLKASTFISKERKSNRTNKKNIDLDVKKYGMQQENSQIIKCKTVKKQSIETFNPIKDTEYDYCMSNQDNQDDEKQWVVLKISGILRTCELIPSEKCHNTMDYQLINYFFKSIDSIFINKSHINFNHYIHRIKNEEFKFKFYKSPFKQKDYEEYELDEPNITWEEEDFYRDEFLVFEITGIFNPQFLQIISYDNEEHGQIFAYDYILYKNKRINVNSTLSVDDYNEYLNSIFDSFNDFVNYKGIHNLISEFAIT